MCAILLRLFGLRLILVLSVRLVLTAQLRQRLLPALSGHIKTEQQLPAPPAPRTTTARQPQPQVALAKLGISPAPQLWSALELRQGNTPLTLRPVLRGAMLQGQPLQAALLVLQGTSVCRCIDELRCLVAMVLGKIRQERQVVAHVQLESIAVTLLVQVILVVVGQGPLVWQTHTPAASVLLM